MKGKKFLLNEFKEQIVFQNHARTTSVLLIPEKLIPIFKRVSKRRTRCEVLNYLLKRYKLIINLGLVKISDRCKTKFQEKGQNLKRFCLKPENNAWVELSILANGLGCTKTFLFSMFLNLEQRGLGNFLYHRKVFKEISFLALNPISSFLEFFDSEGFWRSLKFTRD